AMKHGIYYAYWEQEWEADYKYYIEKVAKLGFDILEIAASPLPFYSDIQINELKACAHGNGITLTVGHGPSAEQNLSSPDPDIRKNAKAFYTDLLKRLYKLDVHLIGGALYSYWPIDYTKTIDKKGDWERSVESVREVAKVAEACGVDFCLEVLNRFENYLINTAQEGVDFVKQVDHNNVKVMLDTFHMNIEEDSIGGAIRTAGSYLGHLHTGECNRKVPGRGRIPWVEIGEALADIGYNGSVVMEPFVRMGGTVGSNIKVWRDISNGADEKMLDREAQAALDFSRYVLECHKHS
uniref:Xylose isomerase domain protein TIM barrel n=1 Tax=Ruminiclostridium cellulolyticum (strain ATCC 35319 / DSM 5812 / JCM 6584 / H10) TaxID=394503 RepID=UPI000274A880|nr:Chain A, Xylose isomerase domain protein TIM barrel [Ruminiclostridium cellulolyticum H10]3VNI_B Chain B, Xylose isomerase domain protein TIM barrel [Ruminiclostridium cellulolyticum H10]3VNI_C Chain C, Xylose isomerase domain protein TIM barrel [Ruminiclostridium cellulolyticum H10]3VNI_D Chain D, Xylose isomerase domain protein TIM barrel [Ruminiclostridium cellulolyticum H10]3VNJ_A Chain A, Xylose isomerase domain protein TIM barrel [Ruminiclostridium cellulolyticum H10]3VNJ_B Chain B, X